MNNRKKGQKDKQTKLRKKENSTNGQKDKRTKEQKEKNTKD